MTTVKTNSKAFMATVKQYVLDCINAEDYDIELTTDHDKLQFLADTFLEEYACAYNLKKYKTYQNMLAEWFQGLPSTFNIDYYDDEIILIAQKWGSLSPDATDTQKYKIVYNWFNFIAFKVMQLMNKEGINIYRTKG